MKTIQEEGFEMVSEDGENVQRRFFTLRCGWENYGIFLWWSIKSLKHLWEFWENEGSGSNV